MGELRLRYGAKIVINPSYEWAEDIKALGISHREVEVFALLVEGHNNKEVAAILGIQYQSVKNHWHSLSKKLKTRNLGQAMMILTFKNVVRIEQEELKKAGVKMTPEQWIADIREVLSDENRTVPRRAREYAKKFMIEHGIYGDMFKDRERELAEERKSDLENEVGKEPTK